MVVESWATTGYHRPVRVSLLLAVLLCFVGPVLGDDKARPRRHIQVRGVLWRRAAAPHEGRDGARGLGDQRRLDRGARHHQEAGAGPQGSGRTGLRRVQHTASRGVPRRAFGRRAVGLDGKRAPAPHGWQGVCPTHVAYRAWRMGAFRTLLQTHAIDGVWLDCHHAHASWERAEPALPDTCFCARCASPAPCASAHPRVQASALFEYEDAMIARVADEELSVP